MIRPMLIFLLLGNCVVAMAADDFKVTRLEQDVRDLQRQVQALMRQVESQAGLPPAFADGAGRTRDVPRAASPPAAQALPAWVDATKWRRIPPGMSEIEVLGILGPPTSMRMQQGARVLLYAMEIGASGFLGGSITLRDRSVTAVQVPTLQ
jgi:outer membrane murein-binding lipoprotein Lpp